MFKNTYISKNISKLQAAVLIGLCVTMLYCLYCGKMQENIAEKVLRLHVVANTDSAEDQRIKLRVRDAVLEVFSEKTAESFEEAEKNAENMLDELKSAAENTLAEESCRDSVNVFLGKCTFPRKSYGVYLLPAGEYTAVNVVIGEGQGHNWWCVMYPKLCTSPHPEEELENSELTPGERRFITADGKYEIRFRILDWLRAVFK